MNPLHRLASFGMFVLLVMFAMWSAGCAGQSPTAPDPAPAPAPPAVEQPAPAPKPVAYCLTHPPTEVKVDLRVVEGKVRAEVTFKAVGELKRYEVLPQRHGKNGSQLWEDITPILQVEGTSFDWTVQNEAEGGGSAHGRYRFLIRGHLGEDCEPGKRVTEWAHSDEFSTGD